MKAEIKKETDDGFGLLVHDNNSAEHKIGVAFDGEIDGHLCESYADEPDNRTPNENEYNEQARRFAKYYIFTERGHDTVRHADNPAYVDAVRQAIAGLSPAEFEEYFGALHQQLLSHHQDVERPVDLPPGVRAEDAIVYELDVYLGVDLAASELRERAETVAEAHGLDLDDGTTSRSVSEVTESEIDDWEAFGSDLLDDADSDSVEFDIGAVSGIHVGFPNAEGEHEVVRSDDPLDREPDATLELMPAEPSSLEEFQTYLDHHLRCQIRDCFVGMGLVPPEEYWVVGFGKFIYARRYDYYDLYPQLHKREGDHGAVIK